MKNWKMVNSFIAAGAAVAMQAHAVSYGFYQITANGPNNVASQLGMDVSQVGANVRFEFTNPGNPIASSICDIYFDDANLLQALLAIDDSGAGVAFDDPATPGNLPGGNSLIPVFTATAGLSADSDNPPVANGINAPGEYVGLTFSLVTLKTFDDVISSLNSGSLRVGLHVQGLPLGQSESYVNGTPVPDGGTTTLLLGMAMLGLGGLKRMLRG